jgi:hypothetical protein
MRYGGKIVVYRDDGYSKGRKGGEKKDDSKKKKKARSGSVGHVTSGWRGPCGAIQYSIQHNAQQYWRLGADRPSNMFASAESSQGCQIAEILQFSCEMQATKHERQQFHCFPIPRLFML